MGSFDVYVFMLLFGKGKAQRWRTNDKSGHKKSPDHKKWLEIRIKDNIKSFKAKTRCKKS